MESANELRDIKKEIIEARGLIIKSNNLASSLGADVRSIAKRQVGYERHLSINSYVAYVIFVVLVFAAVQLVYNQRQAALSSSLDLEKERADKAEKTLGELKKQRKTDDRTQGEDLLALYQLIKDKNREAAIEKYQALDPAALTPLEKKLLDDAIDGFRNDLSMQHYTKGLELSVAQKYPEAVEELRASVRVKADSGHATAAKIEMASAQRLQGKPREAIAVLQGLLEENIDRELSDDAHWQLALAHEDAHQKDEARAVLRALMRQFPDSQYYRLARVKAAELQLKMYAD